MKKPNQVTLDDIQHEMMQDESDFMGYKELSREQLPISKSSTPIPLFPY
jgi:hypothetical protein